MKDQDKDQKTEEPSQHKLDEAFSRGNVFASYDVVHFFVILLLSVVLLSFGSIIGGYLFTECASFFDMIGDLGKGEMTESNTKVLYYAVISKFWFLIVIPLFIIFFSVIISFLIQRGRFVFSLSTITFDFSRASPLSGIGRIFSMRALIDGLKAALKVIAMTLILYFALKDEMRKIIATSQEEVFLSLVYFDQCLRIILLSTMIFVFFLAIFDFFYQRAHYLSQMKMSKQELKEEHKSQYGSPEIKAKIKSLRLKKVRKKMMAAIPTADVIIANPEHIAVALKYDESTMIAPVIVAIGIDFLAQEIKRIAIENFIPIVENRELARSLFETGKLDAPIPTKLYNAVAQIIIYVMKLKGKKID